MGEEGKRRGRGRGGGDSVDASHSVSKLNRKLNPEPQADLAGLMPRGSGKLL